MRGPDLENDHGPVGDGVAINDTSPNISFKTYLADRPAHSPRLRAVEFVTDISITLPHPVDKVWQKIGDFNLWMNRYGYLWDAVLADSEDSYVHLSYRPDSTCANSRSEAPPTRYIVRKIVPQRLIYLDSSPQAIPDKEGVWTGHNLFCLYEEGKQTKIAVFMEHTWYSETMGLEEMRAGCKAVVDAGMAFWREYFIPDLISSIESR